jgi:GTP cyclohydrolase I
MFDGHMYKGLSPQITELPTKNNASKKNVDTPMRDNAFAMSNSEKKKVISYLFSEIMDVLGLDLKDNSLKGTPDRIAKMYVDEVFSGLDPDNKPKISLFENSFGYDKMLLERDISFYSNCEHHFVPFFGRAHVAYISSGKVIGLSKLNRLVRYYASRPQVQERLTQQIAASLVEALDTEDVAVIVEAKHLCVASRGVADDHSKTTTVYYGGAFDNPQKIAELHQYLQFGTK